MCNEIPTVPDRLRESIFKTMKAELMGVGQLCRHSFKSILQCEHRYLITSINHLKPISVPPNTDSLSLLKFQPQTLHSTPSCLLSLQPPHPPVLTSYSVPSFSPPIPSRSTI